MSSKPLKAPKADVHVVRREHDRMAILIPVFIRRADGTTDRGEVEDISEGGARIRLKNPIPANEAIQLEFRLAGMKAVSGRIIEVDEIDPSAPLRTRESAEVRWNQHQVLGVKFNGISPETLKLVKKMMKVMGGMKK